MNAPGQRGRPETTLSASVPRAVPAAITRGIDSPVRVAASNPRPSIRWLKSAHTPRDGLKSDREPTSGQCKEICQCQDAIYVVTNLIKVTRHAARRDESSFNVGASAMSCIFIRPRSAVSALAQDNDARGRRPARRAVCLYPATTHL